jgi:hypothetical protein
MTRLMTTPILMLALLFAACGSSKFQAYTSADKPLFAAINELNKHPENAKAQNDLRVLFEQAIARHENAIDVYSQGTDEKRFDKILNELSALQHMYTSLQMVPGTFKIVEPKSYLQQIESTKQEAAEYFYAAGKELMAENTRESDLGAHEAFKRSNQYISGYKDVQKLIKESYESGIVNVVINPIEDDNLFYTSVTAPDFRYRATDYQESLVRELGGRNANIVPARFYTERDAQREQITADWIVDVRWRNITVDRAVPHQYNRQVSKSVQVGTDTSGKAIYKTVYATLYITQRSYNVQGGLDFQISDMGANNYVDQGLLTDYVNWTEAYATYSGDSRALSSEDWMLINNRGRNDLYGPTKADVLNTLMRKIYPDLRRRIQNASYG